MLETIQTLPTKQQRRAWQQLKARLQAASGQGVGKPNGGLVTLTGGSGGSKEGSNDAGVT